MKLATPKGFRDFLPAESKQRQIVIQKIGQVFSKFGFEPLETPSLEFTETLTGKYGEEEKLIYSFTTKGDDQVSLRYDQTVPLARVVAQYGPNGAQTLPLPLKRYQMQSSFRGENTQKGRYREFIQCDVDIVGVNSPLADAEILAVAYEVYQALNLDVVIKINDRQLLSGIETKYLATIDKLNKIGRDGVISELQERGLSESEAIELFEKIESTQPSENLAEIIRLYTELGYPADSLKFDPTVIRGLDYYTGLILEAVLKSDLNSSSLCGGGRWDNMIGKFTGTDQPAVGFAVGLDRTIEAMEEQGVLDQINTDSAVLVTVFSTELLKNSLKAVQGLRSANIPANIWLDQSARLEKQLKYADQKGIENVVIIGPDEAESGKLMLKNLKLRTQESLSLDELVAKLRQ